MFEWNKIMQDIIRKFPNISTSLKKSWLVTEAAKANKNATAAFDVHPYVAIILNLAVQGKMESLKKMDEILGVVLARQKGTKITESRDSMDQESVWTTLVELVTLDRLQIAYGSKLEYDQQKVKSGERTPDFVVKHDLGAIAIEQTAITEGQTSKQARKRNFDDLESAQAYAKLMSGFKSLVDEHGLEAQAVLSAEEKSQILDAMGYQERLLLRRLHPSLFEENGGFEVTSIAEDMRKEKSFKTSEEPRLIKQAADIFEKKEAYVHSTLRVSSRWESKTKAIQSVRSLKGDGEQAANFSWRILALAIPADLVPSHELQKSIRYDYPHNHGFYHLTSGVVWHAFYGILGENIFDHTMFDSDDKLLSRAPVECPVNGFFIDQGRTYHAAIISIYDAGTPPFGIEGDIVPKNLEPTHVLFEPSGGEILPSEIILELDAVFKFNRNFSQSCRL